MYLVQCACGSWVYQIPRGRRTCKQTVLLAGLGATIVLLAFYQTWLGLAAAGHDSPVCLALLTVSVPALIAIPASGKGEVLRATFSWSFRCIFSAW